MFSPTNLLMIPLLIISILMTLFSNSWLSAWMGLEINTLAFITMMSSLNQEESESSMNYFLPQALASSIFLMFSLTPMILSKALYHQNLTSIFILSSLSLKLGLAPLHQWFPKVANNSSWNTNIILMTIQKIPPLFLISIMKLSTSLMLLFILSSAIIGPLGGLSQTKTKTILAFSSISHMAWMLTSMTMDPQFWLLYLLSYSIILTPLITLIKQMKITSINQMNYIHKYIPKKFSLVFLLLSLGGLPPLLGFFPKWMIISSTKSTLILISLILSTLMNLFFYLRISYTILFLTSPSNSLYLPPPSPSPTTPLISLSLLAMPLMIPLLLSLTPS